jgi:hypothetical protein
MAETCFIYEFREENQAFLSLEILINHCRAYPLSITRKIILAHSTLEDPQNPYLIYVIFKEDHIDIIDDWLSKIIMHSNAAGAGIPRLIELSHYADIIREYKVFVNEDNQLIIIET